MRAQVFDQVAVEVLVGIAHRLFIPLKRQGHSLAYSRVAMTRGASLVRVTLLAAADFGGVNYWSTGSIVQDGS